MTLHNFLRIKPNFAKTEPIFENKHLLHTNIYGTLHEMFSNCINNIWSLGPNN